VASPPAEKADARACDANTIRRGSGIAQGNLDGHRLSGFRL
jgi:hypothetical protein